MEFCRLCPISTILQKGPKITSNIYFENNLNHPEDTLGDLGPQLEFYHRDGIGGLPLGPGLIE